MDNIKSILANYNKNITQLLDLGIDELDEDVGFCYDCISAKTQHIQSQIKDKEYIYIIIFNFICNRKNIIIILESKKINQK